MRKSIFGLIAVGMSSVSALSFAPGARRDTIRVNTKVGSVNVGGMAPDEAARALRVWWEQQKLVRLHVVAPGTGLTFPDLKPSELAVTLDDIASVRNLPLDNGTTTPDAAPFLAHPIFRVDSAALAAFKARIGARVGQGHPARVRYEKGKIVRIPEVGSIQLEDAKMADAVGSAVEGDQTVVLPITNLGVKTIPDSELAKVTDVVSEFTTHFPASNHPRCGNIKLAAHFIDGLILMPGQKFSFNDTVGRRTLKAGFQMAGVYINGQHDTGIGGGICQVSTTLYNAALLANLQIVRRSNHSLPVAYVPLGRDATVDYGNIDLAFVNTTGNPIGITTQYQPGKLTFQILGKKDKGLVVKIQRGEMKFTPLKRKQVPDPTLPLGKRVVVKPGSSLRQVTTFRVLYRDGKVISREPLGWSRYGGQPRIVAIGAKPATPPAPKVTFPGPQTLPSTLPTATGG